MSDLIKKFSSTAIAILILLVAGGYYLFFEKGAEQKQEQELKLFPALIKEEINSVNLIYPDSSIMLSRHEENWYLLRKGKEYKADSFTVATIVDAISDLKQGTAVSGSDESLAEYGLANPRTVVDFSDGSKDYSVMIGADSPVGSGVYLKQDAVPGVMLAETSQTWPFMDRVFDNIRDKEIINLDEDLITQVKFEAGEFSQTFDRQDRKWTADNLAEYIELNQLQIEGIVRSFSDLRVVGFETDEPSGLAKYGLDNPSAVLTITEGDKRFVYSFGDRKEDTDYYMSLSDSPEVYLVSSHNFDQLPGSINDLRIKKLFNVAEDEVTAIKLKNNDKVFSLNKKSGVWSMDNSEGQIDVGKVASLISTIVNLQAAQFVDDNPADLTKYGLDAAKVSIILNDNASGELVIGKEKGDLVYAKKAQKDSVYLIEKNILSLIPATEEDLMIATQTDSQVIESK